MPYPIFLLEGPDCAGKSTMARTIQRKCGAHYIHCSYKFKGRMALYHLAVFRRALGLCKTAPVVIDRWWPSEIAYGNVFRNGPECHNYWRYLHRISQRYQMITIWCVPGRVELYMEFIRRYYHNNPQMYPDFNTMAAVWEIYRDMKLKFYHDYNSGTALSFDVTLNTDGPDHFANYAIQRSISAMHKISAEDRKMMWSDNYDFSGNVFSEYPGILVLYQDYDTKFWPYHEVPRDFETVTRNESMMSHVRETDSPWVQRLIERRIDMGDIVVPHDDLTPLARMYEREAGSNVILPVQGELF